MKRVTLATVGMLLQVSSWGALSTTSWAAEATTVAAASQQTAAQQTATDFAALDAARVTSTVRAVRRARTSTVNIHSEKRAVKTGDAIFQSNRNRKVNGMGTGIVIDERGYIVTNYHVVADVDSLKVTLFDGSTYTARTVSYDRNQDLAVIKIEPSRTLETMPMGTSSDLMLGEDVIAIGNSFGYEHTVTRGIVSALSRDVEVNAEQAYKNLIQTDTAINPGNSGGPLINRNGDVIGINVAIRAGAQKIGFAIPIDDARRVIARLMSIEQLEKNYHGATLTDRKSGRMHELIVRSVAPNSPAARAGLKPGDIISAVGGKETIDAADFERLLLGRQYGESIPVAVTRNGKGESLKMQLAALGRGRAVPAYKSIGQLSAQNASVSKPKAAPSNGPAEWQTFGLRLQPSANTSAFGDKYRGGMIVTAVRPGSPAEKAHVKAGDILVGLEKWETINSDHIDFVLKKMRERSMGRLKFFILRDGETLFGHFQIGPTATAAR